jgi:AraC-like DNA-binding protein
MLARYGTIFGLGTARRLKRRRDGPPVYTYAPVPGAARVSLMRLDRSSMGGLDAGHAHSHDFLLLTYFEQGGGSLRLGTHEWDVEAGDVYVVAPGEVIGVGDDPEGLAGAEGWGVFFPPDGLGTQAPDALLSWRAHPLLLPFARGVASGAQRLKVPAEERPVWSERFSALDRELRERRDGAQEAAVAHLTLLLVDLSRLAADVVGDLRLQDEPLLAEVFGFIEQRYCEGISLKDVASAVSLTPGHLTTVVRRKTGRTVQEWIAERRMAQARRLLVETDLTVDEIGGKVGYRDSTYFVRSFRRAHGVTPLRWRRAGRP